VGDVRLAGKESENGEDDDAFEWDVGALFGSRIGNMIEGVGELFECDVGHCFLP
jgi:hypothetical protein